MHRPHLIRRAGAILSVALLAAIGQIAFAPAGSANSSPAVTLAEPSIAGTSATLGFTANRAANAIASVSCSLTDPAGAVIPTDCGPAGAGPVRKSTGYATTLTGLASGDYRYAVTVTLTDGGTASASTPFTIDEVVVGPFADARAACGDLPGSSFAAGQFWWQVWSCDFDAASAEAGAAATSAGTPLCLADGGYGLTGGFIGPGRYELSCWTLF